MNQSAGRRVVFIASSPHSGSTLLERMLCSHESFAGIGEAFQLVDPRIAYQHRLDIERCSCGATISDCPFWGDVSTTLVRQRDWNVQKRYTFLLERAQEVFGSDKTLIDSSKVPHALDILAREAAVDLRVIHLIRDVRAWTVSIQDTYRHDASYRLANLIRERGLRGLVRFARRHRFYSFHDWFWMQRRLDRLITQHQIRAFRIGYEELCMNPERSLRDLCTFLELDFSPNMLSLEGFGSHNVFGNRMRFQKAKHARISYDHRWFYRKDWILPSVLFPYISAYNRKMTYMNSHRAACNS